MHLIALKVKLKNMRQHLRAEFLSLIQVSHNPGLHDPPAPGKEWTKLRQNKSNYHFVIQYACVAPLRLLLNKELQPEVWEKLLLHRYYSPLTHALGAFSKH